MILRRAVLLLILVITTLASCGNQNAEDVKSDIHFIEYKERCFVVYDPNSDARSGVAMVQVDCEEDKKNNG